MLLCILPQNIITIALLLGELTCHRSVSKGEDPGRWIFVSVPPTPTLTQLRTPANRRGMSATMFMMFIGFSIAVWNDSSLGKQGVYLHVCMHKSQINSASDNTKRLRRSGQRPGRSVPVEYSACVDWSREGRYNNLYRSRYIDLKN